MSALLTAEHLAKSYRCGKVVLRDASFTTLQGEVVAVTGRSGEGKSTIARLLCGVLLPNSGSATLDGKPLTAPTGYNTSIRPAIQLIAQQPYASLDPRQRLLDAVAEPLRVHRLAANKREAREKAAALLGSVSLGSELYDRRPWQISGGQAQRTAIARALAVSPRLMIADEATSMLDPDAQAEVIAILRALVECEGLSVLFISHDMELTRAVASRRYHLDDGILTQIEGE